MVIPFLISCITLVFANARITSVFSQEGDWSNPINISNSSSDSYSPSIAADPEGGVHLIWVEIIENNSSLIMYSQFKNGYWSQPVDIFLSSRISAVSEPSLVCDSHGFLHLAYFANGIEYSTAFAPQAGAAPGWTRPQTLVSLANYMAAPDLVLGPGNSLYLTYAIQVGSGSGVYVLISDDQGKTWSQPVSVYENFSNSRFVNDPQISVDSTGRIHLVWVESNYPETFPPLGIHYANSLDGTDWSDPVALANGPYGYPQMFVSSIDDVHVIWSGSADDRYKFHTWSRDGGETWSDPWRNTDLGGYQGYPAMVEDSDGRLYWLQVGTVFNLPGLSEGLKASLYLNKFSDSSWSSGEILFRSSITSQNMRDVTAAVALGNTLFVANMNPLTKSQNQYQFDIYSLNKVLESNPIAPVIIVDSRVQPTQLSTQYVIPISTKTPLSFPSSPSSISQSPQDIITVSMISSGVIIFISVLVILNRRK